MRAGQSVNQQVYYCVSIYDLELAFSDIILDGIFVIFLHTSLDPHHSVISKLEVCCSEMKHLVQVVKLYSMEAGLRVHSWPPSDISSKDFDLGVVASFGHLIPKTTIDIFPL